MTGDVRIDLPTDVASRFLNLTRPAIIDIDPIHESATTEVVLGYRLEGPKDSVVAWLDNLAKRGNEVAAGLAAMVREQG